MSTPQDDFERGRKRILERIRAYQDGQNDAEPMNAILRVQLGHCVQHAETWERLAERLAWHLSDCMSELKRRSKKSGYGLPSSYGDDGTKALEDFRSLIPADRTIPRDYEQAARSISQAPENDREQH